jgi:secreted trypsin-like serine protease
VKTYIAFVFLLPVLLVSGLLMPPQVWGQPNAIVGGANLSTSLSVGPSARIVGGNTASQLYPWMVSIQKGSHFCGGVLIGQNWVLTAAHCLVDATADQLTLMIGSSNLKAASDAEFRSASWFKVHHDYIPDRFFSDIAIIKLNRPSTKAPIKILNQDSSAGLTQNEQLRVLGWGLTVEGKGSSFSYELQQVDVSFQDDRVCEGIYGTLGVDDYWMNSFCAGEREGGKDACQGDSGGPALVMANNEWALLGLVSWGSGCAQAGQYGAYTEVPAFKRWIEQRRDGVTILGPDKIGFLGENRSKPQTYSIVNFSADNANVLDKGIISSSPNAFSIDTSNWLLENEIPGGYECDFVVNANGVQVGEFDGEIALQLEDDTVYHDLNSKVLNTLDASALEVDWPFYSGTFDSTEHGVAWQEPLNSDDLNGHGSVFKSGAINHEQRSVLLTYLDGSNAAEPHYLKFDAKVDSSVTALTLDGLYLYINEQQVNPDSLIFAGMDNSWKSYSVALPKDVNHVLYMYYKDKSLSDGADAAYLDNFRVCLSPDNEATCSNASAYANDDDLSQIDNPSAQDSWQSVCEPMDYQEDPIEYASRSGSGVEFNAGEGALIKTSSGGGMYWMLWLLALVVFKRPLEIN